MAYLLEVKPAEGPVSRVRLEAGRNRFSVRTGDTYRIYDDQTGLTPAGVTVKRVDNSLVVDGLPRAGDLAGQPIVVEFAEFYTLCSVGSPCELQVQEQASSAPLSITPGTASIGALADGAFVLYDPSYVPPPEPAGQSGVDTRTVLYSVGGLAVAGLVAGGGGGGGSDGPASGGPAQPDGTLKLTSSTTFNNRKPVIAGEGEPGASIVVRIDTDGDGAPNVTYATTVGADFRWSIDLASAVPQSGALPPDGLPNLSTLGISSATRDGTISLPSLQLAFDGTPPAPATIDAVAADNIVNSPEKQAGVTVAGNAEAGSTVLLAWGTQSLATAADANGHWQVVFPADAVPADGQQPITAVVQDAAGNLSGAARLAVTVDTALPPLSVTSVAGGDEVVSIADAGRVRFSGATQAGAEVNVSWNGIAKPVIANGAGGWEADFTGAEVPAGAGESYPYMIVATNGVGNSIQASGQVRVDRVAPAAPVIGIVEGDDRVALAERGDGVAIAGTSEPGAAVLVSWGAVSKPVSAGGDGSWAAVFASGEVPTVGSPGGNTTVTARATDAVGNSGDIASRTVFVEQPFPPPTIGNVAGDNVVSAAERSGGITISGTVNAAAPGVAVTWGAFAGTTAVVGGNWSISVAPAQVPGDGNTTVVAAIAGSPDIASSRAVRVDTTPPAAPAIGAVEGDDRVTLAERQDGVIISGTAEAGASVNVDWNGNGKVATANGAGAWSVVYGSAEVPPAPAGGGNTTVTARATDSVGNQGVQSAHAVFVEQPFPAPTIAAVEGDNVVNAAERADGVVLSGTVQAGVTAVDVAWGGFTGAAVVGGSSWSIAVPAAQVPADGPTTVVATIAGLGGGASQTRAVTVDTTGPATTIAQVTGDDVISSSERNGGFTISGTTEANATVAVSLGGRVQVVTADGAGAWQSGIYGGFDLPPLGGPAQVTATATDPFGNAGPPQVRSIQVESTPLAIMPQELLSTGGDAIASAPDPAGAPSPGFFAVAAAAAPATVPLDSMPLHTLPMSPLIDPLLAIGNPVPLLG